MILEVLLPTLLWFVPPAVGGVSQEVPGDLIIEYVGGKPKYRNGETIRFQVRDSGSGKSVEISRLQFSFDPPEWGRVSPDPEQADVAILTVVDARVDPLRGGSFRLSCEYVMKKSGGSEDNISALLQIRPGNLLVELNVFSSLAGEQGLDLSRYGVEWQVEPRTCSVVKLQGQHMLIVPISEIGKEVTVVARFETGQQTEPLVLCPAYSCDGLAGDGGAPWVRVVVSDSGWPFRYTKRYDGGVGTQVRDNTVKHTQNWQMRRKGSLLQIRGERLSSVELFGIERPSTEWSEEGTEDFTLEHCEGEFDKGAFRMSWEGRFSYNVQRKEGPIGRRGTQVPVRQVTRYRGTMVVRESSEGVLSGTFVIDQQYESGASEWESYLDKTEHPIRFRIAPE